MLSYDRNAQELVHPDYGTIKKSVLIQEIETAFENENLDHRLLEHYHEAMDYITQNEKFPKRKLRGRVFFRNCVSKIVWYAYHHAHFEHRNYADYRTLRQTGYDSSAYVSFILLLCVLHLHDVILGIAGNDNIVYFFAYYILSNIENVSQLIFEERLRRISMLGNFLYDGHRLFYDANNVLSKMLSKLVPPDVSVIGLCPKPYLHFAYLQFLHGITINFQENCLYCRNDRLYLPNCVHCNAPDLYQYARTYFLKHVSLFELLQEKVLSD